MHYSAIFFVMKAATIALALAVLVAVGAASRTERARSGVAEEVGWLTKKGGCSAGRAAGQAVSKKAKVTVDRKGRGKKWRLRAGSTVTTNKRGKGTICLKKNSWTCAVDPATRLRVLPVDQTDVLLELKVGEVTCKTPKRPIEKFVMTGETLTMGGQVESSSETRSEAHASAAGGGELFSMTAAKGEAVVKIRRSTGVLARAATTKGAVVIGLDQQAKAQAGQDPQEPTKIKLTPAERAVFNELEKSLPKETDVAAPTVDINGRPPNPSSVRTATFAFRSNEQAVFSCALDDSDFRLCTSPYQTPRLSAGSHTFKVRATDVAGHITTVPYEWTVDGSRIAFESFRDGNPEIYTVDPDGADPKRLTTNLLSDEHPDWSPDRKKIVFDRLDEKQNLDIWTMNADGTGPRRLTTDGADRNPTWSPDGSRIAFEGGFIGTRQIWVMNAADGTGETQLTSTQGSENIDPAWSPDSRKIVFASNRDGNYEIYVMNADGSDPTRLTNDPGNDFGPSWSKDGRIAFQGLQGGPYLNVFVRDPDGTITNMTKSEHNDTNPSWAPDGQHLVFSSDRDSTSKPPEPPEQQLYVLDLQTGQQTRITDPSTRSSFGADW
jgi:Tol biopolymer transport system component